MTPLLAFVVIFAGRKSSAGKMIVNVVVLGKLQRFALEKQNAQYPRAR